MRTTQKKLGTGVWFFGLILVGALAGLLDGVLGVIVPLGVLALVVIIAPDGRPWS